MTGLCGESTRGRALAEQRRRLCAAMLGALLIWLLAAASAQASTTPENTALPVVSGTRGVGDALTASTGTWSGTLPITYTYQWERCNSQGACTEISGATGSSYIEASGDKGKLVLVTVAATNEAGSATATSVGMPAVSWGQNDHGQLGAIYKDPYEETPIDVEAMTTIKAFSAAESFNLALLSNGTVASFGGDSKGQLGDNGYKANWERGASHTMVKGLTEVTAVAAANEHALALTRNGKVYAWGANNDGMLGRGVGGFEGESGIDSRIPNEVPGLSEKVKAIAVGGASDYALLQGGEVEAWGQNSDGELGVAWNHECEKVNSSAKACKPFICKTGGGNQLCETSPQPVVYSEGHPITNVVAIAAGSESAYALLENGHVLSWGSNKQGALGQPSAEIGSGAKFIPPGEVKREAGLGSEPLAHVAELSAGAHHVLALVEGGAVLGWGSGEEGALGVLPLVHPTCGSKTPCLTQATPIKELEHVTAETVSAGKEYSLVLSGGQVYAFGRDDRGELANGVTSETGDSTPAISTKLDGAVEISAGPTHGLALVPEPPAPHIVVHRETGKIRFSWWNEVGFEANHLNYHEFERPGLTEPEEGAEEECGGEGEGLYPKTCPSIKHEPASSGNLTTTEQLLVAKKGNWHGVEPITYSYQWQLCTEPVEATCTNIAAAEKGTEETYKPTEADLGDYIRLLVTAEDVEAGESQSVTAASELTTRVQKAKAKETTVYSVSIKKEEEKHEISGHELTLPQAGHSGEPSTLGEVPWEFKLGFESRARWFVATPE